MKNNIVVSNKKTSSSLYNNYIKSNISKTPVKNLINSTINENKKVSVFNQQVSKQNTSYEEKKTKSFNFNKNSSLNKKDSLKKFYGYSFLYSKNLKKNQQKSVITKDPSQ